MNPTDTAKWAEDFSRSQKSINPTDTALAERLSEDRMRALGEYLADSFERHNSAMGSWRTDLKKWEKRMEDDFQDRIGSTDHRRDSLHTIFEKNNDSLNVVGGFADFTFAQAMSDLLGTKPFFAALPQGKADSEVAEKTSRFTEWKFGQTNLVRCLKDSCYRAVHLGTAFPKAVWRREIDTYERSAVVLVDKTSGKPVTDESGEYVYKDEPSDYEIPKHRTAKDFEYQLMRVKETEVLYDNADFSCIDFRDISWDMTAPEIDLLHTEVYVQVRMRLLDVVSTYGLDEDQKVALIGLINSEGNETSRTVRDSSTEEAVDEPTGYEEDDIQNPEITLVEGYARIDAVGTGTPVKVFALFIPELREIIYIDYLANVTPRGKLPVFPVRIYRTKGRAYGKGFHARYDNVQNYIDGNFNAATYNNRMNRVPLSGYDPSAVANPPKDGSSLMADPNKVWELQPDKKIEDFVQWAVMPNNDAHTMALGSMMIEMAQLRTGISSAAQGEVSNLPQANTATGIRQLMSRASVLLKWPLGDIQDDQEGLLDYGGLLAFDNMDEEEVFAWGDGQNMEEVTIMKSDLAGITFNIRFAMVQSQNEAKLEAAHGGMTALQAYLNTREIDKPQARILAIQALRAHGFHDAESMVRDPILSMADLFAQVPPDVQQTMLEFIGKLPPEFQAEALDRFNLAPPEESEGGEGNDSRPQSVGVV